MTGLGRQLVFEIAPRPAFGADDFLVSPANETAFALVERWPAWPDPVLLLVGPEGVGKSHLAAIWARRAGAMTLCAEDLRAETRRLGAPVLVDDADRLRDEAGLFHLVNAVAERQLTMLLTASRPPEQWPIRLPDLLSRMRRANRAEIDRPDEDLIRAVLVKLLVDRQLLVETSVVDFIARRVDRSLGAAREVVRRLDMEGLSSGRRISRGLVADVIGTMEEAEPDEDAR